MKKRSPLFIVLVFAVLLGIGTSIFSSASVTGVAETFNVQPKTTPQVIYYVDYQKENQEIPAFDFAPSVAQNQVFVPTAVPTQKPTPAPTAVPEHRSVKLYRDDTNDKVYMYAPNRDELKDYILNFVSADKAVELIECKKYGASMVVHFEDPRVIKGGTAYNLLRDSYNDSFFFDRDGVKLFAFSPKERFIGNPSSAYTFKQLPDKDAHSAWICEKHGVVRGDALEYKGYPALSGYRGEFKISNGFDPEILKSIAVMDSGDNRYDWVLLHCYCGTSKEGKDVPKKGNSGNGGNGGSGNGGNGGNGGGSSTKPTPTPTVKPTPTPTPENNPNPGNNPTPKPTSTPNPENNSNPGNNPTPKPTQKPTPEPVQNPDNNDMPSMNQPSGSGSSDNTSGSGSNSGNEPTTGGNSNNGSSGSNSGSESSNMPSMPSGGNTGYGTDSSDPDPFA